MKKVNIFISSTCYDLSQVRTDLYEAILELGFVPVLSEFPSFPVNPTSSTVENCIETINSSADIFVLIIGNRYGHKLETGKSITNMEFLAAKSKGIPIYVFINKQIINILPVYLRNKTADYTDVVDNPEIFEFAGHVRSELGLWCFEFEKFRDILNVLKIQLSYLFKESLQLWTRVNRTPEFEFYSKLSGKALEILLQKGDIYEYEFLTQVLVDELSKYEELKKNYEYKIVLNSNKAIRDNKEFAKWVEERLSGSLAYISNLMNLINVLIPKYLNEPGKPADLKGLHYVATTYSRVYESFVNWTMETLSVSVADNQKEVRDALATLTSGVIELIWNFPLRFRNDILDAKRRLRAGESNISIRIDLILEVPPGKMEKFNNLFRRFKRFI